MSESKIKFKVKQGTNDKDSETINKLPGKPCVFRRSEHKISRKNISKNALYVLDKLRKNDCLAFLVGGAVRDLCLGKTPKDFDISTSATPDKVRKLFRNSRVIGRRFKINHVFFGREEIIEVSTLRKESTDINNEEDAPVKSDNEYGDPETDAFRRDLTINALFYDSKSFFLIDYVNGMEDLKNGVVRIIGDPVKRIKEDPIRSIRAIRHAVRNNFSIEKNTFEGMKEVSSGIKLCSVARVGEEIARELSEGYAYESLWLMKKTNILEGVLPFLHRSIEVYRDNIWVNLEKTIGSLDSFAKIEKVSLPIAYSTLFIGNITEDISFKGIKDLDRASIKKFLSLTKPVPDINDVTMRDVEFLLKQSQPKRIHGRIKLPLSPTGKIVNQLLEFIKLSRNDLNSIEHILLTRTILFFLYNQYAEKDNVNVGMIDRLVQSKYFEDALFLINISIYDINGKKCFNYWKEKQEKLKKKKKGNYE